MSAESRYFKKLVPSTPIWLSNGTPLRFETVDGNVGYYTTDDFYMLSELDACLRGNRGGVSEISASDYEEFLKKKEVSGASRRPLPKSREEFRAPKPLDTKTSPVKPGKVDAAVAATDKTVPMTAETVLPKKTRNASVDQQKREAFAPRVGKLTNEDVRNIPR